MFEKIIDFIMDHFVFFTIVFIVLFLLSFLFVAVDPETQKLMDINIKDLNFGHLFFLAAIHATILNVGRKK
jgi:ABC-type Mn2+/Zn2+ transport system permease subunit